MLSSLLADHIAAGRLGAVLDALTGAKIEISAIWPSTRHLLPRFRHVVKTLADERRRGNPGT
jgi:DNA-binding transcriptional LysR family regulator